MFNARWVGQASASKVNGFERSAGSVAVKLGCRVALLCAPLFACSSSDPKTPTPLAPDPAVEVPLQPSASATEELGRLQAALSAQDSLDASGFASRTEVPFAALGSYDPSAAPGVDLIQASSLALNERELAALSKHGFVISGARPFPTFGYGYASIYAQDLPLYVSADSIFEAVHSSYDEILRYLEQASLRPKLDSLLQGMASALADADFEPDVRAGSDVYLSVARSLLAGKVVAALDSQNDAKVQQLYASAGAASGTRNVELFGLDREVDFSQFKPRGHYAGDPELEHYFRALIWLGRIELRIIDIDETGTAKFRREQLQGAVALRQLMTKLERATWDQVDAVITGFVGEHDDMTPPQVDALLTGLGVDGVSALSAISDADLAQAVIDGGYGAQRIASQIVKSGPHAKTLPLARSFALLGQRYILDSEVFSNVVYDRVLHPDTPARLLPNPLDVAYAALGNDQAGMLLAPELEKYRYAPELADMRTLADAHGDDYWQGSLYNSWLAALRTLSPAKLDQAASLGLPSVAATDAWGRRLLDTQLASWAELRHDTLLYAKQSYTGGASCSFPTAYVEPYPEFFAALVAFAERGQALAESLLAKYDAVGPYFKRLAETAATFRDMAQDQRDRKPLSAEHLAFVNQKVHVTSQGCGGPDAADGWYGSLFFNSLKSAEYDPTIADVHTQPTDEAGNDVGRVLHVGTGMPELMVVTVDGCDGAQAYVGLASSYYEHVTDNYERLTDSEWSTLLQSRQPRPSWLPGAFVSQ
ncbi:MAG: DUF3160 domain-containing protein [Myxococcales bacterium]